MSGKQQIPRDVLKAVNKKTGKPVTENAVKKLASNVTPNTLKSDAELRRLIKQVSLMAKVPVSEETVTEIVGVVKKSGMNMNNMEALMKMMMKKQ
ncbi:stage VI sporulation protein F [Paenibacillus sp. IB182496]|uniref:Stage VI sporulation protein F n=1 Tax=Paenibacillus sabuli TaxID=2772509 RepID=A0A927BTD4_9BACL|nr:stage VI sporulation protein F [Paenibacillus sabuli]MBD2845179.1 stage VI sporulation protein F [Paenibacillus sabuli]